MRIECQDCHETMQVPANAISRRLRCPRCGSRLVIDTPAADQIDAKPAPQPDSTPSDSPTRRRSSSELPEKKRRRRDSRAKKASQERERKNADDKEISLTDKSSGSEPRESRKRKKPKSAKSAKRETSGRAETQRRQEQDHQRSEGRAKSKDREAGREKRAAEQNIDQPRDAEDVQADESARVKKGGTGEPRRKRPEARKPLWRMRTPDGEIYGPATAAELDEWVVEGRVDAACEISTDDLDWFPADVRYPELAAADRILDAAPLLADGGLSESAGVVSAPPKKAPSGEVPLAAQPNTSDSDVVSLDLTSGDEEPSPLDAMFEQRAAQAASSPDFAAIHAGDRTGSEQSVDDQNEQWNNPPSIIKRARATATLGNLGAGLLVVFTLLAAIPPVLAMSRLWVSESDPVQWRLFVNVSQLILALVCLLPAMAAKSLGRSAKRFATAPSSHAMDKSLRALVSLLRWALLAIGAAAISMVLAWVLAGAAQ